MVKYKNWRDIDRFNKPEFTETEKLSFINEWTNFYSSDFNFENENSNENIDLPEQNLGSQIDENPIPFNEVLSTTGDIDDPYESMINLIESEYNTSQNQISVASYISLKTTSNQINLNPNVDLKSLSLSSSEETEILSQNLLNNEQSTYFGMIKEVEESSNPVQFLSLLVGGAGCGKTFLINIIKGYLDKKIMITTTTGKAATNLFIGAETIHSLLKIPIKKQSEKSLSDSCLKELREKMKFVKYILIDEYSMLSQKNLFWIDKRCKEISNNTSSLFGDYNIILVGDLWQLPPVNAKTLYDQEHKNVEDAISYQLFLEFKNVFVSGNDYETK